MFLAEAARLSAMEDSKLFCRSHSAISLCGRGVSGESIWGVVQNTLDLLKIEVVGHDPAFETLEA